MTLASPSLSMWGGHHHAIDNMSLATGVVPLVFSNSSNTYPTSDLAIYSPVRVKKTVIVKKLFAACDAASGTCDIGLYDSSGTRLVSSGHQTVSTGHVWDVTDTTIGVGLYYLAITVNNTSASFYRDSDAAPNPAAHGALTQQLGAGGALPSSATWAVPQTLAYVPHLAILVETTVA